MSLLLIDLYHIKQRGGQDEGESGFSSSKLEKHHTTKGPILELGCNMIRLEMEVSLLVPSVVEAVTCCSLLCSSKLFLCLS